MAVQLKDIKSHMKGVSGRPVFVSCSFVVSRSISYWILLHEMYTWFLGIIKI